jgi:NTE family protein
MPWSLRRWWPFRQSTEAPKKRLGLSLSGGAVHGAAHVGVLEVLEREGIRPDIVAGVSAGSLVGALYCAGYSAAQIHERALNLKWTHVLRPCRPRLGLFDTGRLETYVDELLGGKTFGQLPIPFVTLAVDILTYKQVVLDEGRVGRAVRASCAVPGLFSPVEWGDYLLVDGGVMNNVPVQLLRERGADYVIAVDLWSLPATNPRPRHLHEMWLYSLYAVWQYSHFEAEIADCTIRPEVGDLSLVHMADAPELIERGRQAAEAALPKLREDLAL